MKKLLLALCLGILCPGILWADHEGCTRSTEGTEFWFGFMEGRNYNTNHSLRITVTSSYNASFTITYGPSETPIGSYTVAANSSVPVILDWTTLESFNSEEIAGKGIHLVADNPVNVYALNYDNKSSDVAVIYPVESIAEEYYIMCYEPHVSEQNGAYFNGRNSEFLIIATMDDTEVEIVPSVETDKNKPAGVPFKISLKKGQSYQVQSLNRQLPNQGDLTGSYVRSNNPIAVYAGNLATSVPKTLPIEAWDHLYEQMPPLYSWGKEYYVVPMKGRESDRYRILASEDGTTVTIDVYGTINLDKGAFQEIELTKNQATRILADKPILVAQFSLSQSVDGSLGDPSMIILSSSVQSKNNVTFDAYNLPTIASHYINIISLTSQVSNLLLDNNPVTATEFSGTDYSYAQISLTPGTHNLKNTDPNEGFLAYVYGFGSYESFGYPVGFNLNVVLDLGENINFDGDTLLLCPGDTMTLNAGTHFDSYTWSTGETTPSIRVAEEGLYKVTTTISDCPELHDSVYVYFAIPQLAVVPDKYYACFPSEVTLEASSSDAVSFLWESMEGKELGSEQSLKVDSTALYRVTAWNEYGCSTTDTADVIVFGRPPVTISADSLVCGELQTIVRADLGSYPDSLWTISPGGFDWDSDDPGVSVSNATDSSVVMSVPDYGTYMIYYWLTTKDGCVSGDTIEVRFSPGPEFTIEPDQYYECAPASVNLQAKVSSDPTGLSYLWQSLEGDTLGFNSVLNVDSTAVYSLSIQNTYGCKVIHTSDVIIFGNPPVTIHADAAECGALSTVVNVDFASYPDSLWDYPGSFQWFSPSPDLVVSDSIDASATVTAAVPGTYDLYYKLTTKDNCVSGDTIQVSFRPVPEFSIISDSFSKCAPDSVHLNADITSDPTEVSSYLWQTIEGDTLSFGLVPDFWVDSTASYLLTVENTYGCRASDTAEVIIFGNPPVTIHAVPAECGALSTTVVVDFAGYPATLWNYPGSFQWYSPSPDLVVSDSIDASATVTATAPGIYDLYYTLTTIDNCTSSDTIQVEFYSEPVAAFTFNFNPTCMSYTDTLVFTGTTTDMGYLRWNFENAAITDTIAEGEYLVQVNDYSGLKPWIELVVDEGHCRNRAFLEEPDFSLERQLDFYFSATDTVDCGVLQTQLTAVPDNGDLSFSWQSEMGYGSGNMIELTMESPGYYDVTLIATSAESGCSESLTKVNYLEVVPSPNAEFDVDRTVVSAQNPLVTFYNNSVYVDAYLWIFGDGERSTDFAPQHEYPHVGSYIATLIGTSDLGCADSTSIQIQVIFDRVSAPNAFRPSSEIVENTVFMPVGLGENDMPFILRIFDRWGQLVFESNSSANPWDGNDKTGKAAPMGNYIWTASFRDITGEQHEQKGQVLLIR